MSDVLRTLSSAYRSALGRVGLLGSQRRSPDDRVPGSSPRGRLFRKYVLLIVGLVSLVLLLNSALDFWFSYEENKAALFRIQQEKAGSAARRIEQFVDEIERQLGWTTAPQWAASPLEQRRFDYVRLLRQAPAITELIQLDDSGKEQLKVSRLAMDVVGSEKDYSQSPSFVEAKKNRVWFSPVYFRKESEPYMTVALARAGRNAGVTVAEVNLKLIWDVITGLKIGQGGYAYVVDREGRLIAHPDISLVLRNTDLAALPQVAAARAEAAGDKAESAVAIVAKGINGNSVLTAHAAIAPLSWTVFVELPLSEALAPLYGSALRTAALLALALVLATSAALLLARRMTVPIRQLQAGAARIGAGELDRRIEIHTGDELEDLAGDFNRMAGDLQKSYAGLEKKVEERTAELTEALEQQTATAEVLGVINASPGNLAPVFDAMLEKALRLCEVDIGTLWIYDGKMVRAAAVRGAPPQLTEFLAKGPYRPARPQLRVLSGAEPLMQIPDITETEAYRDGDPIPRAIADLGGVRTLLIVPLRKDDAVLGNFAIYRREPRPFTDKQIALLQNFAAQAVIAMENARLLTETQEALEQQTATAEVLQVINSSPGDLAPVFDAMLGKALHLCEAAFGLLHAYDGERFRALAVGGVSGAAAEPLREWGADPGSALEQIVRGDPVVHIPDVIDTDAYRSGVASRLKLVRLTGARTALWVALRKDDALLGVFVIYRREVRPFADKQIALLQNFAAQAVIAMENARLITETREALEQQTATAEVLQVINSSPGDLVPVFDAMLYRVMRLCDASFGFLVTAHDKDVALVAQRNVPNRLLEYLTRQPIELDPASQLGQAIQSGRVLHVSDDSLSEAYRQRVPHAVAAVELGGVRTVLHVPLTKDSQVLGDFVIFRQEVRPFTDKQIALLQNFAAQAVIAMENARLITETREALEQQTATAEVLQVINSSPGDLAPVFDSMLEKAMRLCDAAFGVFWTYGEGCFQVPALRGVPPEFADFLRKPLGPFHEGTGLGRMLQGEDLAIHVNMAAEEAYLAADSLRRAIVDLGGAKSAVTVALRKDATLLGALTVFRQEVRPFSDAQIALLQNFAAQAVIAMENARLITETREALEQQTATAEILGVINSSPGDLAPVFDAILEKTLALCAASFGDLSTYAGEQFLAAATRGFPPALIDFYRNPFTPGPKSYFGKLVNGKDVLHVADMAAEFSSAPASPLSHAGVDRGRALVELGNARTGLFLALRKDDALLGAMRIFRQEVQPFTDKQIALVKNFAAQAVIAMENARLLTETREALENQTATAEVLGVINSSPGELAPVFDAMLEKAMRLCGAAFGVFAIYDDEHYRVVANHGVPLGLAELVRQAVPIHPGSMPDRLRRGEDTIQVADITALGSELRTPGLVAMIELGNARTAVWVALRKDGIAQGFFGVYRQEVRPFTEKQIALLQNFAAQAVIAMENARLITETREALEQQTATAEVLQVINSSPGDLAPVFDAILEKAHGLCGIALGELELYEDGKFHAVAMRGVSGPLAELLRQPFAPPPQSPLARLLADEPIVQITDLFELAQQRPDDPRAQAGAQAGLRTVLFVPLRKDDALLGYITAYRQELRPFSEKEIALLRNFAAQAVIAMENTRLITETREALEQQTATAEVLGVINSSPGDLGPVFEAMLEKAIDLCGAAFGSLVTYDGEHFIPAAAHDVPPAFAAFRRERGAFAPPPGSSLDRVARGEGLVHVADVETDPSQAATPLVQLGGCRALVCVGLRKDEALIGAITVYRQEARPFSDKQIALLQNFAAQAVIAMENARLITETREALEQQTATAEVLQVINSSPSDLTPVFSAILEKAHGLCGVTFGTLQLYDSEKLRAVAMRGFPEPLEKVIREAYAPEPNSPLLGLIDGGRFVQIRDLAEHDTQIPNPRSRIAVDLGIRTLLFLPLRKDNLLLGLISAARKEAKLFSEREIALLENFAAQAVIAMENARLITELRQRTRDLQESLEYQTATSDVLKVISRSAFDLQPVLETVAETAARLCESEMAFILRRDGEVYRAAAALGWSPEYKEYLESHPIVPSRETLTGRVVLEGRAVQIADIATDPEYTLTEATTLGDAHTQLGVPLLREDVPIGVIILSRRTVKPFTEKQIELVTTFADQAVIAIENARLLNDLQHRTRDLQESLEYQTATSDVLKVISRSGSELEPVLQTLVETATRICQADKAFVNQLSDGLYRTSASFGFSAEYKSFMIDNPIAPGRGTVTGRVALESRVIQIEDVASDPEYTLRGWEAQWRTGLGVPLFRGTTVIGVIFLARSRVEPFTEKQIELVTTFADQAVIAIENARLFNELRARTTELGSSVAELKMLNEVAQAVSSTLDLRTVLSTVLNASLGVTWANAGAVFRYSRAERAFRLVEAVGWDEALTRSVRELRIAETESAMGEAVAHRVPIQLPDLAQRASYPLRDITLAAGFHSALIVPLVGAERILGAIILMRQEAGEFPSETVRLMQTLASQSVLAIQNARLFREIADKSEQLALASQHKSQFLANMSHELRTPLNAILGYAELLVDGIYGVLPDRPKGVLDRIQNNGKHLLALINDVLDLAKIEAGQLTLTLEDYSVPEVVKSVVTATEPLATSKGLKFTAALQDGLPMAHGDARRVSQVLLNLVGNAIKFTDKGEVEIRAVADKGQFVLTVRDTGPGIADADQERIFGEFQQIDNSNTRKKGGTGLGLAISKRMVEMQGGTISVESVLGQGSTFRVVLPVHVDEMMEAA